MRGPLGHQQAPDGRAACEAGLTGALIDAVAELEEAAAALGVHVIGYGGTTRLDGLSQHCDDGVVEPAGARIPQPVRHRQGMYPGAKQGFVGVDIPQTAQESLVQQQGFDARLAAFQSRREILERHLQRLGAQAGDTQGEFLAEFEAPELAAVVEEQNSAVEGENHVRVPGRLATQQQAASHAEMDGQVAAALQGHHDEFAVALNGGDPAALDAFRQVMGIGSSQHSQAAEFRRNDAASHQRRDGTHHGFYFGKFWHLVLFSRPVDAIGCQDGISRQFDPNRIESKTMQTILVIDDDESLRDTIGVMLEQEGFRAVLVADGRGGFEKAVTIKPDLVLVDLRLPGMSGTDICKQLRAAHVSTPIIVLSAVGDELDKVLLLEIGADDYVVKPFGARELMARIRAVLRRSSPDARKVVRFSDVEVDFERRIVSRKGEELKFTPAEYNLLCYFLHNPDRPLTRDMILNSVWGYEFFPNTRTVDAHVVKLRQKLEPDPNSPRHFITVHGVGYRFVP